MTNPIFKFLSNKKIYILCICIIIITIIIYYNNISPFVSTTHTYELSFDVSNLANYKISPLPNGVNLTTNTNTYGDISLSNLNNGITLTNNNAGSLTISNNSIKLLNSSGSPSSSSSSSLFNLIVPSQISSNPLTLQDSSALSNQPISPVTPLTFSGGSSNSSSSSSSSNSLPNITGTSDVTETPGENLARKAAENAMNDASLVQRVPDLIQDANVTETPGENVARGAAEKAMNGTSLVERIPGVIQGPSVTETPGENVARGAAEKAMNGTSLVEWIPGVIQGPNVTETPGENVARGAAENARNSTSLVEGTPDLTQGASITETPGENVARGAAENAMNGTSLVERLPGVTQGASITETPGENVARGAAENARNSTSLVEGTPGVTQGPNVTETPGENVARGAAENARNSTSLVEGTPGVIQGASVTETPGENVARGAAEKARNDASLVEGTPGVTQGASITETPGENVARGAAEKARNSTSLVEGTPGVTQGASITETPGENVARGAAENARNSTSLVEGTPGVTQGASITETPGENVARGAAEKVKNEVSLNLSLISPMLQNYSLLENYSGSSLLASLASIIPTYYKPVINPIFPYASVTVPFTFLGINKSSGQIIGSNTLTNSSSSWKKYDNTAVSPTDTIGQTEIPYSQFTQLQNGRWVYINSNTHTLYSASTMTNSNVSVPWSGITTPDIKFQQILQLQDGSFAAISFNSYQIILAKMMDGNSVMYNNRWIRSDRAPGLLNVDNIKLNALNDKPDGDIQFNNILQLQNGIFAAINKSSNQIIISSTLVNYYRTWFRADGTSLSGPADTGNGDIQFSQITQLQNGLFAALEYKSNQVYITNVLTNNSLTWTKVNTGDLQFSQILQSPKIPSSAIVNYPWYIIVYNYTNITSTNSVLPTYFSDEYNNLQIFPAGAGTSTTPNITGKVRSEASLNTFPGTSVKLNYYVNNSTGTNTYENANLRQTNTIDISYCMNPPGFLASFGTIIIYVRNDSSGNIFLSNDSTSFPTKDVTVTETPGENVARGAAEKAMNGTSLVERTPGVIQGASVTETPGENVARGAAENARNSTSLVEGTPGVTQGASITETPGENVARGAAEKAMNGTSLVERTPGVIQGASVTETPGENLARGAAENARNSTSLVEGTPLAPIPPILVSLANIVPTYLNVSFAPKFTTKPVTVPFTFLGINKSSGQIIGSNTLTNSSGSWKKYDNTSVSPTDSLIVNERPFSQITQLQNGRWLFINSNTHVLYTEYSITNLASLWSGISTPEIKFQQILQLQDGSFAAISFKSYQIMLAKMIEGNSVLYNNRWVRADVVPQLLNVITNLLVATNDKHNGNIQFNNILQLQNGTFAAINKSSNQIIISRSLVNDYTTWTRPNGTPLSGPADTGNGDIQFSQITQLQNGLFAALEYKSNQIYVSEYLSNLGGLWTKVYTGDLQFSQILQSPKIPSSTITNYPWNIGFINYTNISLTEPVLPTYFSDEYNDFRIFSIGAGTSTLPYYSGTTTSANTRPFNGTLIKLNYYVNNSTGPNTYENASIRQTNAIDISSCITGDLGTNGSGATITIYIRNDNSGNVVLSNS